MSAFIFLHENLVACSSETSVEFGVQISTLNLLSNAEFDTTDKELKAIAAAAIMGFKRPIAATGIPKVL